MWDTKTIGNIGKILVNMEFMPEQDGKNTYLVTLSPDAALEKQLSAREAMRDTKLAANALAALCKKRGYRIPEKPAAFMEATLTYSNASFFLRAPGRKIEENPEVYDHVKALLPSAQQLAEQNREKYFDKKRYAIIVSSIEDAYQLAPETARDIVRDVIYHYNQLEKKPLTL